LTEPLCTVDCDLHLDRAQGCQVADLSAILANFGLIEKLLAEWENPIRPMPKVA
jgi:hypothetical protein